MYVLCVCVYVCMYVLLCVGMYVGTQVYSMYVRTHVVHVRMYACIRVQMCNCMSVCTDASMHVCIHLNAVYVCTYVCAPPLFILLYCGVMMSPRLPQVC